MAPVTTDCRDVEWEQPRQGVWWDRLAPLSERPGEWAVVYETHNASTARKYASNLTSGRYNLPPGRYEFRGQERDGKGAIYARLLRKGKR